MSNKTSVIRNMSNYLRQIGIFLFLLMLVFSVEKRVPAAENLRAPAYPLIACDPYFSVWSNTDQLADSFPVHWTGRIQALTSYVRIDSVPYRIMGAAAGFDDVKKMTQTSVMVRPTNTIYTFEDGGVRLTLTFTKPSLPDNLDLLSRPAVYITWRFQSLDGKDHTAAVYYDQSAEHCANSLDQEITGLREETQTLSLLRMGAAHQQPLSSSGDRIGIDWGYLYLAVPKSESAQTALASDRAARGAFIQGEPLPQDRTDFPCRIDDNWPVAAVCLDAGTVGTEPVERHLITAYNDEYALEYLGEKIRPYWQRSGLNILQMLDETEAGYAENCRLCAEFDAKLREITQKAGGEKYADLCDLAYPEAMAAHKLVELPNGKLLFVSKENGSGGCAATVDVLYPGSPLFILLSGNLLKATLNPAMEYTAAGRWKFPYAPHDVGFYPLLNGQVYGGGETSEENQMPVEETANILILMDVIARMDGNADYAAQYWPQLISWAEYLLDKGLDPENQLCTDDFAGHLAHNANLSIKAIVALACFADLCKRNHESARGDLFRMKAEEFVQQWLQKADAGDHYVLAFDQPESWSQKYNLVWDKLLGLNLFPKETVDREIAYYKTKLNRYGLPLDNRADYTKLDWQVWTATMADSQEDFDILMAPAFEFISATQPRVPMTDWYYTSDARQQMFVARSVVGGVFLKVLENIPLK